jgi:DNA modification methylase
MDYMEFVKGKTAKVELAGFDIGDDAINPALFDFQRAVVRWGLRRGRAIFGCDTGMGKSIMAMEWGRQIVNNRGGVVLILAPLAVAMQFVREGKKHGYDVPYVRHPGELPESGLAVTNYERFEKFHDAKLTGIVCDECSILASLDGKLRTYIIDRSRSIPYRLGCSATPAPNDYTELGNHADYLGIMTWQEMAATFFVHDGLSGGDAGSSGWRLKGHAEDAFWRWVVSWMVFVRRPSDIGYDDARFVLPRLNVNDVIVSSSYKPDGHLFATKLSGVSERAKVRKSTADDRVQEAAKMIRQGKAVQWIAWCGLNSEADKIAEAIGPEAVNLSGDDDPEDKARKILDFVDGKFRVLVTKPKIAGMGLNLQNCAHQVFIGLSDSYRDYYQCIRRSWRYGQNRDVNVWIVLSEIESEIAANVRRKEADADRMGKEMVKRMSDLNRQEISGAAREDAVLDRRTAKGENWRMERGDCVEILKGEPSESVDFSVYSPPFASIYVYTNSPHDMGNSRDEEEFFRHYDFFTPELLRVTRPGRLTACHVSQIAAMQSRDGYIGMKDFRGKVIEAYQRAGWVFWGEFGIQKNPQAQAIRTKSQSLLFATLKKDSARLRPAIADFVLIFRKPGENAVPVKCDLSNEEWIRFAHPFWDDIKETDVLSVIEGREEKDERHICPLQLEVSARLVRLYSNKGETVLSPFGGIGSEGWSAIKHGRKFIGCELKESYWKAACKNLARAEMEANSSDLFRATAQAAAT